VLKQKMKSDVTTMFTGSRFKVDGEP